MVHPHLADHPTRSADRRRIRSVDRLSVDRLIRLALHHNLLYHQHHRRPTEHHRSLRLLTLLRFDHTFHQKLRTYLHPAHTEFLINQMQVVIEPFDREDYEKFNL